MTQTKYHKTPSCVGRMVMRLMLTTTQPSALLYLARARSTARTQGHHFRRSDLQTTGFGFEFFHKLPKCNRFFPPLLYETG
jgi:hypothetical protein